MHDDSTIAHNLTRRNSTELSLSILSGRSKPRSAPNGVWGAILILAVYLAAAIACLWQWNSAQPLARVDIFSGGVVLLLLIWSIGTIHFHRAIFQSPEVMREASGEVFDPLMFVWIAVFAAAELGVFLDYGHWHLVPVLQQPALQVIGLGMCAFAALWLIWTDAYLSRQFRSLSSRKILTEGPYRFVRHPRYAALIVSSVAVSLALASILAWALAIGWLWVNLKRVELEEGHLRNLFGAEYDAYASRTPRFLPGIY
jgi:protein-S-isoprenylcysteine O-methyltransferase Ste14